jgi:2'-5' RNA ligase
VARPAQTVRLFIAIRLPEDVRTNLLVIQREIAEALPAQALTLVKRESLHLTIRFLGDVEENRVPELISRLHSAAARSRPLDLICQEAGVFPDLRFPRVLWAGVRDAAGGLESLARFVEEAAGIFAVGTAEERFVGHVTLGRSRRIHRREAERLAKFVGDAAGRAFGNWRCENLELIRSELLASGSRYSTVASFTLGPRAD